MVKREIPQCGDLYRHFKGEFYIVQNGEVVNCTNNADPNEKFVLYRNNRCDDEKFYIRKLEEFMSPVDKEKYPDAKQFWRFEKVSDAN